jgi:hypothetical protein
MTGWSTFRSPALCAILCILFAAGISAGAQEKPRAVPSEPAIPDWKPAIVSAAAVAFGEALERSAPPRLREWYEQFLTREMPSRRISPREIMARVDREFPKNSDAARDAAIFLVYFLGYREEERTQRHVAAEIRRMDDEAYDIRLRIQIIKDNEMNRMVSPRISVSQQQLIQNDEEIRNMDLRLRDIRDSRKERMKNLARARQRADEYLKVMAVTHPRMEGIPAGILREFQ